MAVEFSALEIKLNEEEISFQWGEQTIGVKKYLPIEEKDNIIQLTLTNAKEVNGLYNPVLVEMYFNLFLVLKYTDIMFAEEELRDAAVLYDALESSGFIDAFIGQMNPHEYEDLYNKLMIAKDEQMKYGASFYAATKELLEELPKKGKEAIEIMEKFKPELFQQVMEFAKAANAGREIE